MPEERWHSVNVVTTIVALAAACFAGLHWHTAERERVDAKQQHELEMKQITERMERLNSDYQVALAKRDLTYQTAVKELQNTNRELVAQAEEKERLVVELRGELSRHDTANAKPTHSSVEHSIFPDSHVPPIATLLIGKWINVEHSSQSLEFYSDGTVTELTLLKTFNGTFRLLSGNRVRAVLPGLLWGDNVVDFSYIVTATNLTLNAPNGLKFSYKRAPKPK